LLCIHNWPVSKLRALAPREGRYQHCFEELVRSVVIYSVCVWGGGEEEEDNRVFGDIEGLVCEIP